MGLATLARMAFSGADLGPLKAQLLDRVAADGNDADALMDLSIVLQLMGKRQVGLSLQNMALELQQLYRMPCAADAAGVRLLAIVSPGDLAQNNAVEFLTEGSDISLDLLYTAPDMALPAALPDHDVAMVAVCETDENRATLRHIEALVESWPRPVVCRPDRIARLSRDGACRLLQSPAALVMPVTARIGPKALGKLVRRPGSATFPSIVRPVDSQKGMGLMKLDGPEAIRGYLKARSENDFYMAPYVDYRSPDGQFRKYRIVLIGGRPYACHMAISDRWIVHYMNAGMRESAAKRAEEQRFFDEFDEGFARRHEVALRRIAERLELEYVGIDCGETPDGRLLIFEVDSGMTVHAMDPAEIFPYKQPQMRKVFAAFRQMLADARP